MPNFYQLAFLLSIFSTFSVLVIASRYFLRLLADAGYDPSNLILLGLPKVTSPQPQPSISSSVMSSLLADLHAVRLPLIGETDLVQVATSPVFWISAAALATTAVYATVLQGGKPKKALDPNEWKEFPLKEKVQVSPNTAIYRFRLPGSQDILGLPTGQHVAVSATINGKLVVRSYTPVTDDEERGYFDLLIKTYEKGNISRLFGNLKIGESMRFKGPKGSFLYTPGLCDHLSMIAGGTGITPMLQVTRAILRNPLDRTTVSLIYANVNFEDILLREEIEDMAAMHPDRFKVYLVLNNPPNNWKGGVGFVSKEHIKEHLKNPHDHNSKVLLCGPPPMIAAMKKNLEDLGFPTPNTISKLNDKAFAF